MSTSKQTLPSVLDGVGSSTDACKLPVPVETPIEHRRRLDRERWHRGKTTQAPWYQKKQAQVKVYGKRRNKEKKKAYDKAWLANNRERKRAVSKAWRVKNPNAVRAYTQRADRKYKERHPERVKQIQRNWKEKNPWAASYHANLRRMRILNSEVSQEVRGLIAAFYKKIRATKTVICYYCQIKIPGRKATIDHVVPVSKGGRHHPDNFCVSCAFCNSSKHAKLLGDWNTSKSNQPVLAL